MVALAKMIGDTHYYQIVLLEFTVTDSESSRNPQYASLAKIPFARCKPARPRRAG
jgi:hypothetical protein